MVAEFCCDVSLAEVRSIGGFDAACDWWSLGALLYELLVGKVIFLEVASKAGLDFETN